MPRIPLPQQPDVVAAPYQGAAPADTSRKYRGIALGAEGLENVGGLMQNFALRSQAIKNRADEVRVEQAIKADEESFQTWISENPDETKWADEAHRRTVETQNKIGTLDLAPEVQREASEKLKVWAQDRVGLVANQAERYANKRHDQVLLAQIESAAAQGDKATIDSLMDEREMLGLVHPDVAAQAKEQYHQKADMARVDALMATDPNAATAALEDPKQFESLTPDVRLRLQKSARQEVKALHAQTYREFQDQINQGNMPTPDQLQKAVDAGELLPTQVPSLKRQIKSSDTPFLESQFAALRQSAVLYDPANDDDLKTGRQDIEFAAAHLPEFLRSRVMDALNRSDSPSDGNALTRTIYQEIATEYGANFYGNVDIYSETAATKETERRKKEGKHFFGADDPYQAVNPGQPVNETEFISANRMRSILQAETEKYLSKHPEASYDEVKKHLNGIQSRERTNQLGPAVVDDLTGAVP